LRYARRLEGPAYSAVPPYPENLKIALRVRTLVATDLARRADAAHWRGNTHASESLGRISMRQLIAAADDLLHILDHVELVKGAGPRKTD
jgi:hypothetical protein